MLAAGILLDKVPSIHVPFPNLFPILFKGKHLAFPHKCARSIDPCSRTAWPQRQFGNDTGIAPFHNGTFLSNSFGYKKHLNIFQFNSVGQFGPNGFTKATIDRPLFQCQFGPGPGHYCLIDCLIGLSQK
jgi:hypothetical protein